MLSEEKITDMQEVVDDCKSFSGMSFSGNHYKVSQFQKSPMLLGEALDEILSLREQLAELKALPPVAVMFPDCEMRHKHEFITNGAFESCCEHHIPLFTAAKPAEDLKRLVISEISDFCAGLGQQGEPTQPEDIQKELMKRIIPLF